MILRDALAENRGKLDSECLTCIKRLGYLISVCVCACTISFGSIPQRAALIVTDSHRFLTQIWLRGLVGHHRWGGATRVCPGNLRNNAGQKSVPPANFRFFFFGIISSAFFSGFCSLLVITISSSRVDQCFLGIMMNGAWNGARFGDFTHSCGAP